MKSLEKEFLFDAIILSLILSLVYSFLVTTMDNSLVSNSYTSDLGFAVFSLFFLSLYIFHTLVSSLKYVVAKIIKNSFLARLLSFNLFGLLLIGAICFLIKDTTSILLIISLVFFNISSYVNKITN